MQQIEKYVLSCDRGIIQFLTVESRQEYIVTNNITGYTLSEFLDMISEEPDPVTTTQVALQNDLAFSNSILTQFLVENNMLGVYQAGMSQIIRSILEPTFEALLTGSLQDAVALLKGISSTSYDSVFITEKRLLCYLNAIEEYLGTAVTQTLS